MTMRSKRILPAILGLAFMVASNAAFAAVDLPQPNAAMGTVGTGISSTVCAGGVCGDDIGTVTFAIMSGLRLLVNGVAVLVIVITGFLLVTSQDENQLSTARKTIFAAIMAMILINVAEPIHSALITGFNGGAGAGAGAGIISGEVLGIIDFIEEPILVIAVLMIIISGIRAVITFGTDQGITNIRRTVFSICAGIILLVFKVALARSIGSTAEDVSGIGAGTNDAQGIVDTIVTVTGIIVGFMALAGVVVIAIAGIILVVNKGDQEVATRARSLIIRVLLGLAVILISYGIAFIFVQIAGGF